MLEMYNNTHVKTAVYQVSKKGNWCCGDCYYVIENDDYFLCAVVDGLGSGVEARESSSIASSIIDQNHHEDVKRIMELCNQQLVNKRGAVITIIKVDFKDNEIMYSNIGNISFVLYLSDGTVIRPIPSRGYLSGRKLSIKVERFTYKDSFSFIMYSDGLDSRSLHHAIITQTKTAHDSAKQLVKNLSLTQTMDDDLTFIIGKL